MRDDIIEACALAALHARGFDEVVAREIMTVCEQRHLADLHRSLARAVLAAFKEATSEPTPGMVDKGWDVATETANTFAEFDEVATETFKAMHEVMFQEIGI